MDNEQGGYTPRDRASRSFRRWVWETDRDDIVPTALAQILLAGCLLVLVAIYATPWIVLAFVLAPPLILSFMSAGVICVMLWTTSAGPAGRRLAACSSNSSLTGTRYGAGTGHNCGSHRHCGDKSPCCPY